MKQEYLSGARQTVQMGNIFVGYKLAEILSAYLTKPSPRSLENEPFIGLILSILRDISLEIPDESEIPKVFFESPSTQLRSSVRQGPSIKTKKGTRANLYVPLSFVKSAECDSIHESTKRDLTQIGSSVIQKLDEANKLPIGRASEVMPFLKEYIAEAYTFSDTCRKEWRINAFVPNTEPIIRALVTDFPSLEDADKSVLNSYIMKLKREARNITFVPVTNDKEELARIRGQIQTLQKTKSARRG
jgi:hypothetical protein